MKYFEFSIIYGSKANPSQHSGRAIARNLSELMKAIETELFVITGKWQTIQDGILTEITQDNYFQIQML